MGKLLHDGNEYEFEDRLLAHLKFVIGQKFKKQECFFLSWDIPSVRGNSLVSVWLSPYIPVTFHFSGSREPQMSKAWVHALNALSHGSRGLVAMSEEAAEQYVKKNPDLM
ncbi:hypothetical protein [Leucobacter sp. L43]|uniref:DUF7882 family protein n=1 Tax=Leucobacter sp. L43 TaxID=2798040 RepID=UPI001902D5C8|nr:hypothetical protein [Leucobacter sp. L43]